MSSSNYTFSYSNYKFGTQDNFSKQMQNISFNKATQKYDITIKMSKENSEICLHILYHNFNISLFSNIFPNSLIKTLKQIKHF